jgi:hypothetical protein
MQITQPLGERETDFGRKRDRGEDAAYDVHHVPETARRAMCSALVVP